MGNNAVSLITQTVRLDQELVRRAKHLIAENRGMTMMQLLAEGLEMKVRQLERKASTTKETANA